MRVLPRMLVWRTGSGWGFFSVLVCIVFIHIVKNTQESFVRSARSAMSQRWYATVRVEQLNGSHGSKAGELKSMLPTCYRIWPLSRGVLEDKIGHDVFVDRVFVSLWRRFMIFGNLFVRAVRHPNFIHGEHRDAQQETHDEMAASRCARGRRRRRGWRLSRWVTRKDRSTHRGARGAGRLA